MFWAIAHSIREWYTSTCRQTNLMYSFRYHYAFLKYKCFIKVGSNHREYFFPYIHWFEVGVGIATHNWKRIQIMCLVTPAPRCGWRKSLRWRHRPWPSPPHYHITALPPGPRGTAKMPPGHSRPLNKWPLLPRHSHLPLSTLQQTRDVDPMLP